MKTGIDLINEAKKHIGEKYILGSIAPKNNFEFKGPWDCAEFISWVVKKVANLEIGTRNGDSYTGYWHEDTKTKCKVISIEEAAKTVGAILLRIPRAKLMGHIVFSLGTGRTIEAMDKNNGVKSGRISERPWDMGLLINGINYSELNDDINIKPPIYSFKFLNPLMKDPLIMKSKIALNDLGFNSGIVSDLYDENMEAAVYNYQIYKGLLVDGILGKQTLKSLKVI